MKSRGPNKLNEMCMKAPRTLSGLYNRSMSVRVCWGWGVLTPVQRQFLGLTRGLIVHHTGRFLRSALS